MLVRRPGDSARIEIMASRQGARHTKEVSKDSDEPDASTDEGVVLFPGTATEPLAATEDIVWFDPDTLAQRSEIGKSARRPGWWCPENLAPEHSRTPCWGAVQPALCPKLRKATPLWNDPELPLVKRWSHAQGLAIACSARGFAYALLDQMLESLVVGNLFEREPEPHRALLVTQRSAQAWWQDLLARWMHTTTPEGHAVNAQHPDFARHWLLVSYEVWEQDQGELQDWLLASKTQKAIAFHLPGAQAPWANLAGQGQHWALEEGLKFLVAGTHQDLDALAWDPRDRILLSPEKRGDRFGLSWDHALQPGQGISFDPGSGIYYF